jgi:hypothetical protein
MFASSLTRRYLVAHCWKNSRSAGLEVLKRREMRASDEARTCCRAKVRVHNWDVRQMDHRTRFRLVRTFDLAPPSGRVALGRRFPGLKPWAEFSSPFGAQNEGHNPRIVAYSPSEQNHPKPLSSRHSEEVKRGRITYTRDCLSQELTAPKEPGIGRSNLPAGRRPNRVPRARGRGRSTG